MADMAQGGVPPYPPVFVVDTYTAYPPAPPRPSPPRRGIGVAQTLLFLLVSLALCGMAVEACFIYRLYHPDPAESASKSIQDKEDIITLPPTKRPNPIILPSKPAAHLTDGQGVVHGDHIMSWSTNAEPLYEMEYKDGTLVIQKEGYYYIYSKVYFTESITFHHSVCQITPRYLGKDIPLLVSRRYTQKSGKSKLNSYMGGVFHLFKGDAIFVKISNTKLIIQHAANENYFGAFMI